jgi:glycosyltransferase involved in cell wall biosynthesis
LFHFDPAKRQELRRTLGLEHRFVVVYSGNLAGKWQVPHRLVEMFLLIRRGIPDAFFLILTPEKDRKRIAPHLQQAGLSAEHFSMHSCPHGDVVRYLCAGDVGLLLRERHPANEAGAPGKFAEYMLSGLPIVMTEGIGDFSEQVRDQPFACVLPGLDRLEDSTARIHAFCRRAVSAEDRFAQSRWGAERFSTELRIAQLAALYRSL